MGPEGKSRLLCFPLRLYKMSYGRGTGDSSCGSLPGGRLRDRARDWDFSFGLPLWDPLSPELRRLRSRYNRDVRSLGRYLPFPDYRESKRLQPDRALDRDRPPAQLGREPEYYRLTRRGGWADYYDRKYRL